MLESGNGFNVRTWSLVEGSIKEGGTGGERALNSSCLLDFLEVRRQHSSHTSTDRRYFFTPEVTTQTAVVSANVLHMIHRIQCSATSSFGIFWPLDTGLKKQPQEAY
ncbi:hypothetical protein Cob_v010161 [Colletotrichum orbiculare MAFF 240422]|uniref:Uncharacterized protein n=1 Tax=Colletotrichum orbiculare (strain 104-T / ATCC 96160 / CBS 514.97 / LARS 414 / MAFF 240422) TaxID=1213857 RepID=A0A484FFK3_COLOR|nr:hypothetical protein Cob_v010161 [Colletotrichum orbiculare MAFF 240422]